VGSEVDPHTMEHLITYTMTLMQFLSLLIIRARALWKQVYPDITDTTRPHRRYFLGSTEIVDDHVRVPEDQVYVEEWVQGETKRCVVKYEGEEIPTTWTSTPFDTNARTPWVWVGDRETEIDLTRTFNKFLVVGNVITLDLVLKLIHVTESTNLIYIESGTFKELKFPGDGITIEEYVD
jgi:hypothetical protein